MTYKRGYQPSCLRGFTFKTGATPFFSVLISDRFHFKIHSSVPGGVIEAGNKDGFFGSLPGSNFYVQRIVAIF
jgi:hypothetical protein